MMKMMKICVAALASLMLAQSSLADPQAALLTPPEVWENYDPDAGDFKEAIIKEETKDGIYYKESYISAYVNGEEVRVFCKYSVKAGAKKAPGLMDVHGWYAYPRISQDYVNDGWAVLAHGYAGYKFDGRKHYTKYPEALSYGNMKGPLVNSHRQDRSSITAPEQASDYVWYALQRRALSYLLAQKEVDADRIGAKGYSYGGTTMWNLGMDPRVKAIVAYFGIGWLEYYRTNSVWMYNRPYREPKKTPGQELYLSAVAPQAHVPYITAASLWLNGSNDHHGGHERGCETFKMFKPGVPWDFAIQARGHHNTEKLGDDCKLWLEKHVLGKAIFWPARPKTEIKLDAEGVPELHLMPASIDKISELKAYYALKDPVSFGRAWRDAEAVRQGDVWVAKLPVLNVDDYVFAFANIRYDNNCVVSSDFESVIPTALGNAVATDTIAEFISEGAGQWSDVAPVEGVGGIQGFRPLSNRRGTASKQFADPKWKAPKGSELSFQFYCTQPQALTLSANEQFEFDLNITASNEWQTMTVKAEQLKHKEHGHPLRDWSELGQMRIAPKTGADISKVMFAKFKWIPKSPVSAEPDAQGRFYLTKNMASQVDTFWQLMDDQSIEGKQKISVSGTTYERGLGVHADSCIVFRLDGKYQSFHVVPGPDDAHYGSVEMKIMVDGKEAFASGKVSSSSYQAKALDISVAGAKELILIVTDGGDGKGGDHASWGDAYLTAVD